MEVMELYGTIHDGERIQNIDYKQYVELMRELPNGWAILQVPREWILRNQNENQPHGKDSYYAPLTNREILAYQQACAEVLKEANANKHKRPKMTTLLEEFSELVLSLRGKHDDPPEMELRQVASVAINLLWQLHMGHDINNIVTIREKKD